MPADFKRAIDQIFIVMLENRSFDHMLGYASLAPWSATRPSVEGLQATPGWIDGFTSVFDGHRFPPHLFAERRIDDPPHTRATIATQLATASGAAGPMTGFVASYATRPRPPRDLAHVMGYYTASDVPIFDFFLQQFTTCDHWFSSLPAGTQPNRLMAMAGFSTIDDNTALYLPDQELVYDWLTERGISWRVYHDGLVPFMGLMQKWMDQIHDDDRKPLEENPQFRWFDYFEQDVRRADVQLPSVVFIEPDYTDIPLFHSAPPNDDHPPSSIDHGQRFLRRVYQAITANPQIWMRSVIIVAYDEHGGFFDHVSPPAIPTEAPADHYRPFSTLGIRVPAFVISPFVEPATVATAPFDHTSILTFLADRFAGDGYSAIVEERRRRGLARLSDTLTRDTARPIVPVPPQIVVPSTLNANEAAFRAAVTELRQRNPAWVEQYMRTDSSQAP